MIMPSMSFLCGSIQAHSGLYRASVSACRDFDRTELKVITYPPQLSTADVSIYTKVYILFPSMAETSTQINVPSNAVCGC